MSNLFPLLFFVGAKMPSSSHFSWDNSLCNPAFGDWRNLYKKMLQEKFFPQHF